MSSAIDVPQYVADEFNRPFRHPGQNPGAMERSVGRVLGLLVKLWTVFKAWGGK